MVAGPTEGDPHALGIYAWDTTETFTENGFVSEDKDSGTDAVDGLGAELDVGNSLLAGNPGPA